MTKIVTLTVSVLAFGLAFASAAQAEDTMMEKPMHKSSMHHMKKPMMHKGSMMSKDKMKGDAMMKDDAPAK